MLTHESGAYHCWDEVFLVLRTVPNRYRIKARCYNLIEYFVQSMLQDTQRNSLMHIIFLTGYLSNTHTKAHSLRLANWRAQKCKQEGKFVQLFTVPKAKATCKGDGQCT